MIVAVIFYVAWGAGSFSGCRFISFELTSFRSRTHLESRNDPMALMLRQHYKHWLEMSEQGKRVRNRQHESLKPKLETLTPVDAIYAQEPE